MSYQVIARKYRPQTFEEVVGQKLITDTLRNAILHNRVAHGYIFSGARGVGKTTTARVLAKALNCATGPTVTPCGRCDSCREIAAGNSVDVLEIDAASNRGIEEIRELRETVRYLPARDRYKVFIIDEVHMLTTEAFNALLKTLEEPPSRSLFILATTEPHKLPSTIQSRCQHFAFRLLDYSETYSRLEEVLAAEKIQAEEGALSAIAQAAEGSLRDALSLLDQVIAFCGDKLDEARVRQLVGVVPGRVLREILEAIHAGDGPRVLELVNGLVTEGYELAHFCAQFTRYVRDLMVAKSCGAQSPLLQVPSEQRKALRDLAELFDEEDLARFFQILLKTEAELRYSLRPRFHLELALVKLLHARKLASLEGLLAELAGGLSPGKRLAETPSGGESRAPTAGRIKTAEPPPAGVERTAPALTAGEPLLPAAAPVEDARLTAIKALVFNQSKFLGSCLEPVLGWRFENGEVRFTYAKKDAGVADLVRSREQQETLRNACAQVLGEPVKIYVTLEEQEGAGVKKQLTARERAAQDSTVEAFRKRFNCSVVDVKDLSQE